MRAVTRPTITSHPQETAINSTTQTMDTGVLQDNIQLEKLEAAKAAYLWLPFLTFGYLFLPLVNFPYLSLTFLYLLLPLGPN